MGERLVEVWMDERMLARLTGVGIRCSRVVITERADGTFELETVVPLWEARRWDWPITTERGDGESLVRDAAA